MPAMKGIPSTMYRVRSNSLSSAHRVLHTNALAPAFLDPGPPPVRPGILSQTSKGLPADHPNHTSSTQHSSHSHGGHPPFPLALGTTPSNSSQSQSQYAMFTYSSSPPKGNAHPHPSQAAHEAPLRAPKRQRLKYHLDVGAYGIPKRCRSATALRSTLPTRLSPQPPDNDDLGLAVQVGEDAYFVRDNAMGVADGVGGWAKRSHHDTNSPSPSALFARRLMHYCSAEVESATASRPTSPVPPTAPIPTAPQFSFQHHLKPRQTPVPVLSPATSSWLWNEAEEERLRQEELEQELEDSLEELSEGINVLQILEQAYDRTIKAHVAPAAAPESLLPDYNDGRASPSPISRSTASPNSGPLSHTPVEHVPLMSGSSTALLAVLDHAPRQTSSCTTAAKPSMIPEPSLEASPSAAAAPADTTPTTKSSAIANYAAGTLHPSITLNQEGECDAVIRVAHIGDCMGMLVRGDEIVWRSEEMWWDFNMPLQLGPVTHPTVTPSTSAHYFTLPVRADDILILASDGLSDNLWDEDVLDEVTKFRRNFLEGAKTESPEAATTKNESDGVLRRKALAGMLSEALCSRARKVSEQRWSPKSSGTSTPADGIFSAFSREVADEVPFARRAREAGRVFRGGKQDDISVIVAVISPGENGEVMLGDKAQ